LVLGLGLWLGLLECRRGQGLRGRCHGSIVAAGARGVRAVLRCAWSARAAVSTLGGVAFAGVLLASCVLLA